MIKEDYVSFETAKLLKEKGFDEPCDFVYDRGELEWIYHRFIFLDGKISTNSNFRDSEIISAPTMQMAMKWLREVHKVFIYIEPFITTSGLQGYKPYCTKIGGDLMWVNPMRKYSNTSSDTPEEACEVVLKYCLENLI